MNQPLHKPMGQLVWFLYKYWKKMIHTPLLQFLTVSVLGILIEGMISEQCIIPLGMEEGKIPDNAITASSSYEMKSVGPQNARFVIPLISYHFTGM